MKLRTGETIWAAQAAARTTARALPHEAADAASIGAPLGAMSCDVAVIGGGVTGAAAASMLAEAGASVIVFDRRPFGAGSTAASTGLLTYELDAPLLELSKRFGRERGIRAYRASADAFTLTCRTIESSDDDCGFTRRPSIYLAADDRAAAELAAESAARREAGIDAQVLDRAAIEARFRFTAPAAIWSPTAGQCDPLRLTMVLLGRAARHGARLFQKRRVAAVELSRNSQRPLTLRLEAGGDVRADWAIVATGYECPAPGGLCPRPVGALKSTFAVCSAPVNHDELWHERCLIWESRRPYAYVRTTDDHRVMIGGADVPFSDEQARDALLATKTDELVRRLRSMFPDRRFEPEFCWAGAFGESDDGLPYVGALAETPRRLYALGYGGNGITLGMLAAEILRETVLGRAHSAADLFAFSRER